MSILGIRVFRVSLIALERKPVCKKPWIVSTTSTLMIFQNLWKKTGDIPYGPGDLFGCIENTAILISFLVTGLVSCRFTYSVIVLGIPFSISSNSEGFEDVKSWL